MAIPPGEMETNVTEHPILFTNKIEAAHAEFAARAIHVKPIQSDSGGNRFFRFCDLDDNEIEGCLEP